MKDKEDKVGRRQCVDALPFHLLKGSLVCKNATI